MKKKIHPKCYRIIATCSCGNKIHIYSTLSKDINLDVCNLCHPFYTGKQKIIRTGNRLSRFNKQFSVAFKKDGKSEIKK